MKRILASSVLIALMFGTISGAFCMTARHFVPKKKEKRIISRYAPLPIIPPNSFFKERAPSVFMLTHDKEGPSSGGTGFQVTSEQTGLTYLLTNQHVCELADANGTIYARHAGQPTVALKVLKVSETDDICAVSPVPGAPGLTLARKVSKGQYVMVLGHPRLRPLSVAAGIILGQGMGSVAEEVGPKEACGKFEKRVKRFTLFWGIDEFCERHGLLTLLSTAPALPGNSGSPVLDLDGKVVAIVYSGDKEGLSSGMVPLQVVTKFLNSLSL